MEEWGWMGERSGVVYCQLPFESSYLKFSDSMPNNTDKNHIAIQLISFPLKMQPLVHQWKADTVARQPLPGGCEVGSGGWCFRKGGEMLTEIQQVMAGMATDICKIYIYVLIPNTKIEKNCDCQFDY